MELLVKRVPAALTFPLRHQVLRPHERLEQLALPGDHDPESGHFAALAGAGEVVGTATVRRVPPPWQPERLDGWRLRGMATAEDWRSRGVGTSVLAAVVDHVAAHGGGVLWCNARLPAVTFYERGGFVVRGDPWEDPVIGPHVVMFRVVEVGSGG